MKKQTKKTKRTAKHKRALPGDIIQLILNDHKPLKKLLKVMKSDDASLTERKAAYKEFVPLLTAHAKAEEKSLYTELKTDDEMRTEAFEGDVEHGLADQMAEEAKRTDDKDVLSAKIKVLAELVEHHIKEEEDELLPEFRKNSEPEDRVALGEKYLQLKEELEAMGGEDAPSEKKIKRSEQLHA